MLKLYIANRFKAQSLMEGIQPAWSVDDSTRDMMEDTATERFHIRAASVDDADDVGPLVARLLIELYPDLQDIYSAERLIPVTRELLKSSHVFGLVARSSADETVGVIMINQCEAIYAFGHFGEISELYVDPRYRSSGVGAAFLQSALDLARSKNWSMLEVGAPDVPRWQKTVDFYTRNGFTTVGPRLYLPLN